MFFITGYISVSNLIYGSVAAILAFLLWAYLSGLIFLFGAFLIVSYYRLNLQRENEKSLSEQTPSIGMADNNPQAMNTAHNMTNTIEDAVTWSAPDPPSPKPI